MVKTRSQTGNITIKKEQEEDVKPTMLLNDVSNTRRSSRIAKRKPSVTNSSSLPALQVKVEGDTDTKSLLKSRSKSSKGGPNPRISQEQINQLIHYIVNDNMNVAEASRKVNISKCSGSIYYKLYNNDPEKKIPLRRDRRSRMYTQEQIGNLIRYIDTDKMTVKDASEKADMPYHSASHYYSRYLKDPNHNIPVPRVQKSYTQDQKNEFIGYITNDNMSVLAASKKQT
jgi:hypothetical protein